MEMRGKMAPKTEEGRSLDEGELKLRERTLSRTPSDTDRPKTESGINAPEGGGQGMVSASGEKRGDDEKREETAKRMKPGDLGGR